MFKQMINWLIYTVCIGILPMVIAVLVCKLFDVQISYTIFYSGMFFFDLSLLADAMKELTDIEKYKKFKTFLSGISNILIIIVAVVYGVVLLNEHKDIGLDLNMAKIMIVIFTVSSIIVDISTEIAGGIEHGCK